MRCKILLFALLLVKTSLAKFIIDDYAQQRFDDLFLPIQHGFHQMDSLDDYIHSRINIPLVTKLIKGSDTFYGMKMEHKQAVQKLKDTLLEQNSIEEFLSLAEAMRLHKGINNKAWLHAILMARVASPELRSLKLSVSLPELLPDHMFAREILEEARRRTNADECVVTDDTFGKSNEIEDSLWYFRHDNFANAHHTYWHIHHGFGKFGDRRGELFWFMHHEFLARFETERITNGLPPLTTMPIEYGVPMLAYDSHLTDANSGRNFTPRTEGAQLGDAGFLLSDQIISRERIIAAIAADQMVHVNESILSLQNMEAIDILGSASEAYNSVNPPFYGNYHNLVHFLIAAVMDPTLETRVLGVMAATSASMRDPIFYPFHKNINEVLLLHKDRFVPYSPDGSDFPLKLEGVTLLGLEVQQNVVDGVPNALETHWSYKEYNVSMGLDWMGDELITPVCGTHLDHNDFVYNFEVESSLDNFPATFRIFLAPRFNGAGERFTMEEQRLLFFTLDTFTTNLTSGVNSFNRSSLDSRLTVPSNTWQDNINISSTENYCGCGWPRHMLLPKGTPDGFTFDLFVIVTDGTEDLALIVEPNGECSTAPIWCGVLGEKYPDSRPAGYPFDRRPYVKDGGEVVQNLEEYVENIPNMKTIQVTITHQE